MRYALLLRDLVQKTDVTHPVRATRAVVRVMTWHAAAAQDYASLVAGRRVVRVVLPRVLTAPRDATRDEQHSSTSSLRRAT